MTTRGNPVTHTTTQDALRPDPPHRLFDSQWVNVVNHENCYRDFSKEEAVALAVKLTEQAMAKNFRAHLELSSPAPERVEVIIDEGTIRRFRDKYENGPMCRSENERVRAALTAAMRSEYE